MPISIDRFEESEEIRELSTSERIVRFLLAHSEQAFTRREIAEAIDTSPETVGTNLTRLKDRGLVRHREPYWAMTDDRERALSALRARYEDAYLNKLLGEENWEEWKQHAATPEEIEQARDQLDDE